jgi:hypothetical protein
MHLSPPSFLPYHVQYLQERTNEASKAQHHATIDDLLLLSTALDGSCGRA